MMIYVLNITEMNLIHQDLCHQCQYFLVGIVDNLYCLADKHNIYFIKVLNIFNLFSLVLLLGLETHSLKIENLF